MRNLKSIAILLTAMFLIGCGTPGAPHDGKLVDLPAEAKAHYSDANNRAARWGVLDQMARAQYYVSESGQALTVRWEIDGYRLITDKLLTDGLRIRNTFQFNQSTQGFDVYLGTGDKAIYTNIARLIGGNLNIQYSDRPNFMVKALNSAAVVWDNESFYPVSFERLKSAENITLDAKRRGEAEAREQRRQFWGSVAEAVAVGAQVIGETSTQASAERAQAATRDVRVYKPQQGMAGGSQRRDAATSNDARDSARAGMPVTPLQLPLSPNQSGTPDQGAGLSCIQERQCKSACPKDDRLLQCQTSCSAKSRCKVNPDV
jgi:hypothetical protein